MHSTDILTVDADKSLAADDLRNAYHACLKAGDYFFLQKDYDNAASWYQKSHGYITNVAMFSKAVDDARLYLESLLHLYKNTLELNEIVRASEWIDEAVKISDGIAQSTGLSKDITAKERVAVLMTEYQKIRRENADGTGSKSLDGRAGVITLMEYEHKNLNSLAQKSLDEIENYIDAQIGSVALQFNETHPLFKGRDKVWELGRLLTKNKYSVAGLSEKGINEKKYALTGRITDILLKQLETLKYDEMAMLIVSYCGFYNIREARHIIGGKEKALTDRLLPFLQATDFLEL